MKTRILFFTCIALLVILLAACQPTANNTNEGTPGTGDQTVVVPGTTEGSGETGASECANIDSQTLVQTGNEVYTTRCASCHGEQGEGVGTFPGLTNNESLNAADVAMTLQTFFNPEIHPFLDDITNQDVAAVLSYARSSFGNQSAVICPEQVDIVRPSP